MPKQRNKDEWNLKEQNQFIMKKPNQFNHRFQKKIDRIMGKRERERSEPQLAGRRQKGSGLSFSATAAVVKARTLT